MYLPLLSERSMAKSVDKHQPQLPITWSYWKGLRNPDIHGVKPRRF
jgi:hypothetical protein